MLPKRILIMALFLISTIALFSQDYKTIYVDASMADDSGSGLSWAAAKKTIYGAQEAVRTYNKQMTGDIRVIIAEGIYFTENGSYKFDENDSGFNGHYVIYQNKPGDKVILSAGRMINTSWTNTSPNVYTSNDKFDWYYRQLYVNDKQRFLPKTEIVEGAAIYDQEPEHNPINTGFKIPKVYNHEWAPNHNPEIMIIDKWTTKILRIDKSAYREDNDYAYLYIISPDRGYIDSGVTNVSFSLLNSGNWLNDGSFFRESDGQIYYRLASGEAIENLEIIAPMDERLIEIVGNTDNVRNIHFFGLSFQHSNWIRPKNWGFSNRQASALQTYIHTPNESDDTLNSNYINPLIPGAIFLENSEGIIFENSRFENLGADGLELYRNVNGTIVKHCYFGDIAGGAISLYTYGISHVIKAGYHTYGDQPNRKVFDEIHHVSNNIIIDNLIENCGTEYYGTCGIFMVFGKNNLIQNNTLRNLPYSGISLGWGWTSFEFAPIGGNIVKYNEIYDVMKQVNDGAGIYTLSNHDDSDGTGKTKIYENHIHDISYNSQAHEAPVSSIYFDEGSAGINVFNNDISTNISNPKSDEIPFQNLSEEYPDGTTSAVIYNDKDIVINNNIDSLYIRSKAGILGNYDDYDSMHQNNSEKNGFLIDDICLISSSDISINRSPITEQIADIDNDGDLDIIINCEHYNGSHNYIGNGVYVYLNSNNRYTLSPESYWLLSSDIHSTVSPFTNKLADMNKDGLLDLIINWKNPFNHGNDIFTYINTGDGFNKDYSEAFSIRSTDISETASSMSFQTADMNNDGFLDMIINWKHYNGNGNDIYTFINDSYYGLIKDHSIAYSIYSSNISVTPSPMTFQTADMNNDGLLDLIINWKHYSDDGNDIYTFINNSSNGLNKDHSVAYSIYSSNISVTPSPMTFQTADMNNDGLLDMIINWEHYSDDGNDIYTFINNSSNGLNKVHSLAYSIYSSNISDTASPMTFQTADMNNDGLLDIIVNWEHYLDDGNDIYTFINNSSYGLNKDHSVAYSIYSSNIAGSPNPMTCIIADVNNDSLKDMIINYSNPVNNGNDIYLNIGK